MNWLKDFVKPRINALVKRKETPSDLWSKCTCGQLLYNKDLEENLYVCSSCDKHLHMNFNARFKFDDVRYTNWDKYGGIAKPYYGLAKLLKGERYADTICLRMYDLSTFPVLFWSIEIGYLVLMGVGFWRYRRK